MSKEIIEIVKCNYCGGTMKGRLDDNTYRNYCGVKSKDIEEIPLDFCHTCWEYVVKRSKNKKELFKLIEKETDWIICDYEYVGFDYKEEWGRLL